MTCDLKWSNRDIHHSINGIHHVESVCKVTMLSGARSTVRLQSLSRVGGMVSCCDFRKDKALQMRPHSHSAVSSQYAHAQTDCPICEP